MTQKQAQRSYKSTGKGTSNDELYEFHEFINFDKVENY